MPLAPRTVSSSSSTSSLTPTPPVLNQNDSRSLSPPLVTIPTRPSFTSQSLTTGHGVQSRAHDGRQRSNTWDGRGVRLGSPTRCAPTPQPYIHAMTPKPFSDNLSHGNLPKFDKSVVTKDAAADNIKAFFETLLTTKAEIVGLEKKAKNAAKAIYWLQVAGAIMAIAVPILGLSVVWWAVLPVMAAGVLLYLLSWYYSHQENKCHNELVLLKKEVEQIEHARMTLGLSRVAEGRSRECEEEFRENLDEFCSGLSDIIKSFQALEGALSSSQEIRRRIDAGGLIMPAKKPPIFFIHSSYFDRRISPAEEEKVPHNITSLLESMQREAKKPKTLRDSGSDLGESHIKGTHKIESLKQLIEQKEKSAHQASMTAFWLRLVGIVVGVAGPLLALITNPWVTLPFLLVGTVIYFLSWHFSDRFENDRREIMSLEKAIEETDFSLQNKYSLTEQLYRAYQDRLNKFLEVVINGRPFDADQENRKVEEGNQGRDNPSAKQESLPPKKSAARVLSAWGIDYDPKDSKSRHHDASVWAFNYDPNAVKKMLEKEAATAPRKRLAQSLSIVRE